MINMNSLLNSLLNSLVSKCLKYKGKVYTVDSVDSKCGRCRVYSAPYLASRVYVSVYGWRTQKKLSTYYWGQNGHVRPQFFNQHKEQQND